MLTWFTEDSLVPLILGSLLVVAFMGLAITHYSRAMFLIALAIGLLTATIVGIETYVVTDREAVQALVRGLSAAAEKNQVEEIVAAVSDTKPEIQEKVRQEMQTYTIDSCRLVDFVEFNLNDQSTPHTADTTFVVFARGGDKFGNRGTAHERVTLYFEKDGAGNWKIINYAHQYARAGGRL